MTRLQEYEKKLLIVQRLLDRDAPSTKLYQLSLEELQALRYAMHALEMLKPKTVTAEMLEEIPRPGFPHDRQAECGFCPVCQEPQHLCPSGVVCKNGHGF